MSPAILLGILLIGAAAYLAARHRQRRPLAPVPVILLVLLIGFCLVMFGFPG